MGTAKMAAARRCPRYSWPAPGKAKERADASRGDPAQARLSGAWAIRADLGIHPWFAA